MNIAVLLLAQSVLPAQVATVIRYGIYAILVLSFCWGVVKVIKGIQSIERGEEGKMGIIAGVCTPLALFLVIGAFQAIGLWANMGITLP